MIPDLMVSSLGTASAASLLVGRALISLSP